MPTLWGDMVSAPPAGAGTLRSLQLSAMAGISPASVRMQRKGGAGWLADNVNGRDGIQIRYGRISRFMLYAKQWV